MHKKGQGAMEYLMTYGWAIIVVVVVGIVLWQMGVFTPSASTASGFSGFGQVKPLEWSCNAGTDTLTITFANGAGGQITNVNVGGTDCSPTTVPAGNKTVCTIASDSGCAAASAGSRYESTVSVSYTSPTGMSRTSTGKVWGSAE